MLDRNKLAKQFELVVQQEIKNYNDQILSTNLAINSIREKIAEHEKSQFFQASGLFDKLKNQEEKIASLENALSIIVQAIEGIKSSTKKIVSSNVDIIETVYKNNDALTIDYTVLSEKVSVLHKMLSDAKTQNDEMYKNFSFLLTSRDHKIQKDLEAFKVEIQQRPSEIQEVRKSLEDKIAVNYVDVNGIMRELQHYKKSAYVMEKKIENLYTLIERLQDGKK